MSTDRKKTTHAYRVLNVAHVKLADVFQLLVPHEPKMLHCQFSTLFDIHSKLEDHYICMKFKGNQYPSTVISWFSSMYGNFKDYDEAKAIIVDQHPHDYDRFRTNATEAGCKGCLYFGDLRLRDFNVSFHGQLVQDEQLPAEYFTARGSTGSQLHKHIAALRDSKPVVRCKSKLKMVLYPEEFGEEDFRRGLCQWWNEWVTQLYHCDKADDPEPFPKNKMCHTWLYGENNLGKTYTVERILIQLGTVLEEHEVCRIN